jgi:ubiquinone/menaquinone biosynthesis C-methylase UbiE
MIQVRDPEGIEVRQLGNVIDFANRSVVEIGCGDGRLTRRYAAPARQVAAVDPDMTRLTTAVEQNPASLAHVNFVQAQAETLPFASEKFDLAVLAWSL